MRRLLVSLLVLEKDPAGHVCGGSGQHDGQQDADRKSVV